MTLNPSFHFVCFLTLVSALCNANLNIPNFPPSPSPFHSNQASTMITNFDYLKYLEYYGYMDYARAHVHFGASQDDTLKLAILTFQVNFGLSQTGELNEETMLNEETHGDGAPFDGPKGVLAHAFAPDDGHLHFDADENWSFRSRTIDAYHFETVATHEIGHILGMGHSTDIDALMFPSISMGEIKELDVDDIYGISVLYPPPF